MAVLRKLPIRRARRGRKGSEHQGFGQWFEFSEELQVAVPEGRFEGFEEQTPKKFGQHSYGEEEARTASDPALVIR